ncbi:MAG: hypothetical protein JSS75_05755 [Bacteroidetes bacterium]|nr:hypothetical protein [Bacteroidota bacterium]
MKFRLLVLGLLCLPLAQGCSLFYPAPVKLAEEKAFYDPYPSALSDDYFHSPVGDLAGHYPSGWLQTNIEHIQPLENVAFVYTDSIRSWALTLIEIPGSASLRRRYDQDGLLAVAEESINIHRSKIEGFRLERNPEVFTQYHRPFANYEISRGPDHILHSRYVVFTTGVRFYELGMVQLRQTAPAGPYLSNYRLLQSVIGSLEGVPSR